MNTVKSAGDSAPLKVCMHFYSHEAFSLTCSNETLRQLLKKSLTAPLVLFDFNFQIPKLWAYLAGNVVTQYICIRSVYVLTSECASLTVTLVVTLRKFMSLMFSIFYFQNPFTVYHWCGTVLVFGGTLIFVELASKIREALVPEKEIKQEWWSLRLRGTLTKTRSMVAKKHHKACYMVMIPNLVNIASSDLRW